MYNNTVMYNGYNKDSVQVKIIRVKIHISEVNGEESVIVVKEE